MILIVKPSDEKYCDESCNLWMDLTTNTPSLQTTVLTSLISSSYRPLLDLKRGSRKQETFRSSITSACKFLVERSARIVVQIVYLPLSPLGCHVQEV